jgi:TRAP-type C4-dicarboxylate transport system permease small subunit
LFFRLARLHDGLTVAGFALAAALIGAIAAGFCYEVAARYFFDAPTTWLHDFASYALAAVIFLSIPAMTQRGAHVAVGYLVEGLSEGARRPLGRAVLAAAAAACLAAAWIGAAESWRQYAQGVETISANPIPKWWVSAVIPYGFASSALYFLRSLFPRA